MKKRFALLSLFAVLACSSLASTNQKFNANSATGEDVVYTTFGPGELMPTVTDPVIIEGVNLKNYSLAYRGAVDDYRLMLFPSVSPYGTLSGWYNFSDNELRDTDLSLIKIYYSETQYFTAEECYAAESKGRKISANIYADYCVNFSIPISGYKGVNSADTVYKITIESGFVLPYVGESTTQYVLEAGLNYKNPTFGNQTVKEIVYKTGWEISKVLSDQEEIHYVACSSREDGYETYRIQIRDSADTTGFSEDDDSGNCYILFLFPFGTYNEDLEFNGVRLNPRFLDKYNFLDKIHFVTSTNEELTLRDVVAGKGEEYYYNIWGEKASIAFKIGNKDCPSGTPNYNGKSFSKITIESGCEFPSYETTNGDSTKVIKYIQSDTISLVYNGGSAYWSLQWLLDFDAGSTTLESVKVEKSEEVINEANTNYTYVSLKFDNTNYTGDKQYCTYYTEYLLRNVFVNGHSVLTLNGKGNTHVFINLKEKGTLSLSINDLQPSDINEVIVKKGCQIVAYSSTGTCIQNYGKSAYYYNSISKSFSKNSSGDFVLDDVLYWTLWFNGENPIRVENNEYFSTTDAPDGVSSEFSRFICWLDMDGNEVYNTFEKSVIMRITSSLEFVGKYLNSYIVNVVVDGTTTSYKVDHNKRLTQQADIKNPVKAGYLFDCWVDENGNEVNIDNLVRRNMTITAKFYEDFDYVASSKGCKGSVISTCLITTLLSACGLSIILIRKRKTY